MSTHQPTTQLTSPPSPMREQIIQLERDDDYHSVRDKIGWAQTERILLVWPEETPPASVLERKLDLRLIHRHASNLGAHLGLITLNPQVADNATDLEIPVFNKLGDSHLFPWRSRLSVETPFVEQRKPLPPRPHANPATAKLWPLYVRLPIFLVALLVPIVPMIFLIPSATVTLTLATQQLSLPLTIQTDPLLAEIDVDNRLIPSQDIEVSLVGNSEAFTTGNTEVATNRAAGEVTFSNLTAQVIRIPAGTAVRTSSESTALRFVTQQDANLQPRVNATDTVPVIAVEAGPIGNVSIGKINRVEGPLSAQVAVLNSNATAGGEVVSGLAVTEADQANLQAELEAQLLEEGFANLVAQLAPGQFAIRESAELINITPTFDHFIGEQTDRLALELQATVTATVIDERLAFDVGRETLVAQTANKLVLFEDTVRLTRNSEFTYNPDGSISFDIVAEGTTGPITNRQEVRNLLRGVQLDSAQSLADDTYPVILPTEIEITPSWLASAPLIDRLPWLPWRIHVEVAEN